MRKKVNCSGFFKNERAPMGGGNPPRSCCCCCFAFTYLVFDSPPLPLSGGRKEREIERESKRGKKNPLFFFNSFCCFCCRSGYRAPSLSLSLSLSLSVCVLGCSFILWLYYPLFLSLRASLLTRASAGRDGASRASASSSRPSSWLQRFWSPLRRQPKISAPGTRGRRFRSSGCRRVPGRR